MKNYSLFLVVLGTVVLATACNGCRSVNDTSRGVEPIDFDSIAEYYESPYANCYADSLTGHATFSGEGNIVVVPQEITEKQYCKLLTDKYTVKPVEIDTVSALFAKLNKLSQRNIRLYNRLRSYFPDADTTELELEFESYVERIWHYPATGQYRIDIWAPLTTESFMISEDGVIDTTFMQSDRNSAYGTNGIFVGQTGHDCDYHGSLWFYRNDGHGHMIPICHYVDYRWNEDCDFNLCWINDTELLVAAASNGNSTYGWVGGYKPTDLAPHGTPVYYKLKIES